MFSLISLDFFPIFLFLSKCSCLSHSEESLLPVRRYNLKVESLELFSTNLLNTPPWTIAVLCWNVWFVDQLLYYYTSGLSSQMPTAVGAELGQSQALVTQPGPSPWVAGTQLVLRYARLCTSKNLGFGIEAALKSKHSGTQCEYPEGRINCKLEPQLYGHGFNP